MAFGKQWASKSRAHRRPEGPEPASAAGCLRMGEACQERSVLPESRSPWANVAPPFLRLSAHALWTGDRERLTGAGGGFRRSRFAACSKAVIHGDLLAGALLESRFPVVSQQPMHWPRTASDTVARSQPTRVGGLGTPRSLVPEVHKG